MKRVEENRNKYVCNISEMVKDEEENEDEDVATLSSLDSYQVCQKFQQVMNSHAVRLYSIEHVLMLCSSMCLIWFLCSQLQLKLRSASSQLHQAREKVSQSVIVLLALLRTNLQVHSCYRCTHI